MHIVFLTSSSNKSGGSRQALYLAQGLEARGHRLSFFVPCDAELPSLAPDIDWLELPRSPGRWRRAVEAVLRDQARVFHAFHNRAVKKAAWWGLFWRRRGLAVFAQRGVIYRPNNPLPYWSPGIDRFIVNSNACAAVLRQKGVRERRLVVVPNAIPRERITPQLSADTLRKRLGLADGCLIAGCVANDSANKGVSILLKAFAQANIEARLVIVGATPARFAPEVEALGLTDRVRLPGSTETVADYLQLFDLFVLPSLHESMPNALQEAMCLGLPVLASSTGGVPECVQGNGLLVPPGDRAALAAGLQEALADPARRARWGQRSLHLATSFAPERKAARVEAVYEEVLQQRGLN